MYERYFHLRDQPFRLTPDPRYLYLGTKHREGFAHLLFAMREGSGFVAVTGEVGTGKTTLVRALLRETHQDDLAVAYIFNPVLSPTELLQTINAEFGLPSRTTSKKELTEMLNNFLLAQKADGARAVVIVDEAQNLDQPVLEQLRLLSNLETETEKLLQIILLGQPELRDVLDRPDLRQLSQRVALRWHLEPLDRRECHKYVRHRLRVAGGDELLFEPKALDVIYEYSAGLPRLVNILAHRALLVAFTQGAKSIGPAEVGLAAAELGEARVPLQGRPHGWAYKAAAGAAVTAAAAGVALLLVAPLRDDSTNASPAPPAVVAEVADAGQVETKAVAAAERRLSRKEAGIAEELTTLREKIDSQDSFDLAQGAITRLVNLWTGRSLTPAERAAGTIDLEILGARRGLSYFGAELTPEMLALIDLPAIIEISLDDDSGSSFILLENASGSQFNVYLDSPVDLSEEAFVKAWTGRAHFLWNDAESLREPLAPGATGPAVTRLQLLLSELGVLGNEASGVYDEATREAVETFQGAYGLEQDGTAGVVTQMVLYNAIARYDRPVLAGSDSPRRRVRKAS
jgi:general secretion pathway protein A